MYMAISLETKLDYDRTVSTEDRFTIRKVMDKLVKAVNNQQVAVYTDMFSDAVIVEGFSDIPAVKQGFCQSLERRFKTGDRTMRFPELKLSFSRYLFHLDGTYEEYLHGILATEGTITISMIKEDENYKIVRIMFYPRMMMQEVE